jgi:hypothetical protein
VAAGDAVARGAVGTNDDAVGPGRQRQAFGAQFETNATVSMPGRAGRTARPPTLRKMRGALRRRSPTSSVAGPTKRASPTMTSVPFKPRIQASTPSRDFATMASLRAITRAMSTRRPATSKPNSAPRCESRTARALATIVFVGTQPTLTQVPPKWWRSMTAVFSPSRLQRAAIAGPA